MREVLLKSRELEAALAALPDPVKGAIEAKPHPWIGLRPMVILVGKSREGDDLVRRLAAELGVCRWSDGRWHVQRVQLSLFPAAPAIL